MNGLMVVAGLELLALALWVGIEIGERREKNRQKEAEKERQETERRRQHIRRLSLN